MQLDRLVTRGGHLYRTNAKGENFVWIPTPITGLGELGGLWKKVTSIPRRTFKAITKTTIGRTAIRVAGTVAAPFTGGLSLAAAEAAARYGKARYQMGLSRGAARRRGAVGGIVGGAIGYGVSRAYGAYMQPRVASGIVGPAVPSAAPVSSPFGTIASGAAAPVSSPFGTVAVAGTVAPAVTPTVSFLPELGNVLKIAGSGIMTAAKAASTVLPVLASTGVLQRGTPGTAPEYYENGPLPTPAPFESSYGGGGGWPGGAMPPEAAVDEDEQAPLAPQEKTMALTGILAATAGLVLYFFTRKG